MSVFELKMPKLGESVTEGTIGKWLKQPGEKVNKYDLLVEVQTDKVNTEIPSPVAGTLKEVKVEEGQTVPIGTLLATFDTDGDAAAASPAAAQPASAQAARPASSSHRRAPQASTPHGTTRRRSRRPRRRLRAVCSGNAAFHVRVGAAAAGAAFVRILFNVVRVRHRRLRPRLRPRPPSVPISPMSGRRRRCASSPPRTGSTSRRSRAPDSVGVSRRRTSRTSSRARRPRRRRPQEAGRRRRASAG